MTDDRTLTLSFEFDAPPRAVWRCWTEPELLKQWFAPAPVTTPVVETDVRPGGSSTIVMQLPDGTQMPNRGVYLEIEQDRRMVFTDAFTEAWVPSAKPFMTGIIDLEPLDGGRTRATYTIRHWSAEDCQMHKDMGFETGWSQCAAQLGALVKTL